MFLNSQKIFLLLQLRYKSVLKHLCTGTPKTISFLFVPNGKLMIYDVPIFNPTALRKAKIVNSIALSTECNKIKHIRVF